MKPGQERRTLRIVSGLLLILAACLLQPPLIWGTSGTMLSNLGTFSSALPGMLMLTGIYALALLPVILAAFSPRPWKWGLFLLVAVSMASGTIFEAVAGHPMGYTDWVILWQARVDAWDATSEYVTRALPALGWSALLLAGFLLVPRARQRTWLSALILYAASIGLFAGICVHSHDRAGEFMPSTSSLYGLAIASMMDRHQAAFTYVTHRLPDGSPIADHIVLVIDESVRHDFFDRVVLQSVPDHAGSWHLYDFGLATSMANCSADSNLMLRKLVGPESIAHDINRNPLVWSLAHNAGFETWLLDAQLQGVGGNYYTDAERALIDHRPDVRKHHDVQLVDHLQDVWSRPSPSFSIVIKRGSHFPYATRYPSTWQSESPLRENPYVRASERREQYLNAVDYQTGDFLRKLLDTQSSRRTIVIYTSDHGQHISDMPGVTHCSTNSPPVDEGIVPLVVLTNFPWPALDAARIRNHDRMSQFDLAVTLRNFLGYDKAGMETRGLFGPVGQAPVKGFVYGGAFGYFGNPVKIRPVDRQAYAHLEQDRWQDTPRLAARPDAAAQAEAPRPGASGKSP